MANRLTKTTFHPDLFLSSPANRALTTAFGHAIAFGVKESEVLQDHRLYHASSQTIQAIISETNAKIDALAIFGHNPGLTGLINDLSEFDLWNLPTCAICIIELNIQSWSEIGPARGKKIYYDYPKSKKY